MEFQSSWLLQPQLTDRLRKGSESVGIWLFLAGKMEWRSLALAASRAEAGPSPESFVFSRPLTASSAFPGAFQQAMLRHLTWKLTCFSADSQTTRILPRFHVQLTSL